MRPRWWLEIGPLKEGNYTGISQVTAALAECMLTDDAHDTAFFYGRAVVPAEIVRAALDRRHGELLEWYVARARTDTAPNDPSVRNIAIFPNRKTCRYGFDVESQIIHDLSTLLTPQFHAAETVDYHATSLHGDIHSNTVTFCVSDATRDDVLRYLGPLDPARVVTTHLAPSFGEFRINERMRGPVEPFVLVLGTIEPRKNIEHVLQFLSEQPHILRALRFVFLGRFGWGRSTDALLAHYGLHPPAEAGRILFPGYVADATKFLLLQQARLMIYPSLFEGFGLPVLEALALGTPCLTTRSSSLPEVGGALCTYFDPFTPGDFARAFAQALHDSPQQRDGRHRHAAAFAWSRTWQTMTTTIESYLDSTGGNAR